jgi:DNA invertase Pin-like site-specific DNA recombinase
MKINYIRVSTGTQSKEVQEFNLSSEYKVFKEVVSGSIAFAERTEGAKIIQLVKEGKVEEILIHDISRIGRNNLDILKTIEFFTLHNVNLVSRREGLSTMLEGKSNPIATLIIGILSTLAQHERERLKERQKEGIDKAKLKGVYKNNGGNRKQETLEEFSAKSSTKKILKYLNEGNSLRRTALLSSCSLGKVQKVVRLLFNKELENVFSARAKERMLSGSPSQTFDKGRVDEKNIETKAKKKEIALQVYAQREAIKQGAIDWLKSNKSIPVTPLQVNLGNESAEERAEWERMEREQNKSR